MHPFVAVVLDQGVKKPLDYAVPVEWQGVVQIGMRVEVPLQNRLENATVVALKKHSPFEKIKTITRLLKEEAGLSEPLWKLAHWLASYYCAPLQRVMKCFVPPHLRHEVEPKKEKLLFVAGTKSEAAARIAELRGKKPGQAELLECLLERAEGTTPQWLKKEKGITAARVKTLLEKKWIRSEEVMSQDLSEEEFFPSGPKRLGEEQKECLGRILATLETRRFGAHLIQGVTGSGKTEVYLQAMEAALAQGRSAILLVPEIGLTSQTIERLRSRFQQKIAVWHHRRSLQERALAWDHLKTGEARIIVGARSAIFCPIQNVGLVIVDEEHDASYKQSDEPPCYQGRDVAVMRAYLENAVVVLGSATPSLESRYNADVGKYVLSRLNTRATSALMPKVTLVDMKRELEIHGGFTHFSGALIDALQKRLELGEQSLLLLNKRGYHRLQICASCKATVRCPHCDVGLAYHKTEQRLLCHLCDHTEPVPTSCPQCHASESLQFKGFGTEHVERSLHALLPGVRTLRMDRDTTRKKKSHEEFYQQFRSYKADVLIGTQMIAKGFHFPAVTLVGVLNADAALAIPDFRANEQVFQLITQVAGRAGRSELPGEVILQTFLPDHPLLQRAAAARYEEFYEIELGERKLFSYPPFSHLIKISCAGPKEEGVKQEAMRLHAEVQQGLPEGVVLLPVTPSGHAKVKDLYRFQFIVKTPAVRLVQPVLARLTSKLSFKIDVDPVSTFF